MEKDEREGYYQIRQKIVVKFTIFEVGAWKTRELLLSLHKNNPDHQLSGGDQPELISLKL